MMVRVVARLGLLIVIHTVARNVSCAGIHTILKSGLLIGFEILGAVTLLADHAEGLADRRRIDLILTSWHLFEQITILSSGTNLVGESIMKA